MRIDSAVLEKGTLLYVVHTCMYGKRKKLIYSWTAESVLFAEPRL